jgi:hypothetical protein
MHPGEKITSVTDASIYPCFIVRCTMPNDMLAMSCQHVGNLGKMSLSKIAFLGCWVIFQGAILSTKLRIQNRTSLLNFCSWQWSQKWPVHSQILCCGMYLLTDDAQYCSQTVIWFALQMKLVRRRALTSEKKFTRRVVDAKLLLKVTSYAYPDLTFPRISLAV